MPTCVASAMICFEQDDLPGGLSFYPRLRVSRGLLRVHLHREYWKKGWTTCSLSSISIDWPNRSTVCPPSKGASTARETSVVASSGVAPVLLRGQYARHYGCLLTQVGIELVVRWPARNVCPFLQTARSKGLSRSWKEDSWDKVRGLYP